ncbi:glucosaminidase domain-containing protein [Shewanella maritima]|nr:glucosaminidase domain-containing protein [Shewanella maritima]
MTRLISTMNREASLLCGLFITLFIMASIGLVGCKDNSDLPQAGSLDAANVEGANAKTASQSNTAPNDGADNSEADEQKKSEQHAANANNSTAIVEEVELPHLENRNNTGLQKSFRYVSNNRPSKPAKDVEIDSLDDLMALFSSLNYDYEAWQRGHRAVPRLTFNHVSKHWQQSSHNLPVNVKKEVFFRLMAPLILRANEEVLLTRKFIQDARADDSNLIILANRYRVTKDNQQPLTDEQRTQLLVNVDIVPPSLVLAQGAEESGWGTSRFTLEGNAFFGQWDFSGNGMVPKQQRKELGNYGIARFDSPLDSVKGYLFNLNTNPAYQAMRQYRAELRAQDKPITGLELATTLDKYSERGQAYIDSIQGMIRYNHLELVDETYLSDDAPLHLIPQGD